MGGSRPDPGAAERVTLDTSVPVWDQFFTVAPLVLVGTREEDGRYDIAPKHMAGPLGWANFLGFVCTPEHRTYVNAVRERIFTVSYARPSQVLLASLAAAPRCDGGEKPALRALETFPATAVDGVLFSQELPAGDAGP